MSAAGATAAGEASVATTAPENRATNPPLHQQQAPAGAAAASADFFQDFSPATKGLSWPTGHLSFAATPPRLPSPRASTSPAGATAEASTPGSDATHGIRALAATGAGASPGGEDWRRHEEQLQWQKVEQLRRRIEQQDRRLEDARRPPPAAGGWSEAGAGGRRASTVLEARRAAASMAELKKSLAGAEAAGARMVLEERALEEVSQEVAKRLSGVGQEARSDGEGEGKGEEGRGEIPEGAAAPREAAAAGARTQPPAAAWQRGGAEATREAERQRRVEEMIARALDDAVLQAMGGGEEPRARGGATGEVE